MLAALDTGPLPLAPIRDAARKQLIDVIDSVRLLFGELGSSLPL